MLHTFKMLVKVQFEPLHDIATTLCKNFHLVTSEILILKYGSIFMVVKIAKLFTASMHSAI